MKMKYFLGSLLSFVISITALAQNNPGYDYLSLNEIKLAKDYFTKNLTKSPAEYHFYLGEIAYKEGNMAEARSQYEKASSANAESPFGTIGLAKLELKQNPKEATKTLTDIQKKNKKDISIGLAVAKAFLDNGMDAETVKAVQELRKADKKSPYSYILEGDMLAKENKPGEAAAQYDQAIYNDPNSVLAYMKGAKVYEFINRKTATDLLRKAIEIRPDYKIAYKDLADLNYREGVYADAISAYKEFFSGGDYTVEDIRHYAGAQFFTGNYEDAKKVIAEGMQKEPNDFVLNRLLMYSLNDSKDYVKGLETGDKFFSLPRRPNIDTAKYIMQDYLIYGNLKSENGDKKGAVEQFKKAIELDPSKVALLKSIASTSASEKDYEAAAEYYDQYLKMMNENVDALDYAQLGGYYQSAGAALKNDSTPEVQVKCVEYFTLADQAYAKVVELKPDSYQGSYLRARVNFELDPSSEQGLAKPYYEKTIEMVAADPEPNNNVLIEGYSYLSFYYYSQFLKGKKPDDKAKVKEYAGKVLELNSENGNGKALFEWANTK
ncbi:MAG: tetratricopeptide repeat protein [Prevotella sp.]|jgi:tetratricopeptide (TPR) repeat protein|nr:tetratricopeptide repeat protein [Prevotella sp.]